MSPFPLLMLYRVYSQRQTRVSMKFEVPRRSPASPDASLGRHLPLYQCLHLCPAEADSLLPRMDLFEVGFYGDSDCGWHSIVPSIPSPTVATTTHAAAIIGTRSRLKLSPSHSYRPPLPSWPSVHSLYKQCLHLVSNATPHSKS